MNVFILSTGRCGSTTFIKACQHIINYTAAHESRLTYIGDQRLAYPSNHIEADNRLSWILGRVDNAFGNRAFYVHLNRDKGATAASFAARKDFGIMRAYREGILLGGEQGRTAEDIAIDYIHTVDTNIRCFLRDKTNKMDFRLEKAKEDFSHFWNKIEAQGALEAALEEWNICYNASVDVRTPQSV